MENTETLILYHSQLCGFCWRVRDVIGKLGVEVELRDVLTNKQNQADLLDAQGRGTVPVLRRIQSDGAESWMPESSDIIQYLQKTYA